MGHWIEQVRLQLARPDSLVVQAGVDRHQVVFANSDRLLDEDVEVGQLDAARLDV